MRETTISNTVLERLAIYYRSLKRLEENKVDYISSKELGEILGISSDQIRRDLYDFRMDISYYHDFGVRGRGYPVSYLLKILEKSLGLNNNVEIALIGAGSLGGALISYDEFKKIGLNIKYVFDINFNKAIRDLAGIEFYDVEQIDAILTENQVKMAIIAVPAKAAQDVADIIVEAGVELILNFAPTYIEVPNNVMVRNEDLSIGLIGLSYYLSNKESELTFVKNLG
ncbi:redox-sensing transcriptional repressor [Orenia metallireducens]|uniref:redox-sensing transcriptional repressor Rex n=1 Tax=Orenia metallireducens TaxID=1413210 RepID=UPI000D071F5D|nr:redox-sensing transcriptional repressor Rex [Orenia metallireducens]PRX24188.1 redox-sensing transcriptional repressor [Orenia metallireducens]